MPKQILTKDELRRYNGKDGAPAFVGCNGKVYDMSNSFHWKHGRHQAMHSAGADLTSSLSQAPHGEDMFDRVPIVGVLSSDE